MPTLRGKWKTMNERRWDLINKQLHDGILSDEEQVELKDLQKQIGEHINWLLRNKAGI